MLHLNPNLGMISLISLLSFYLICLVFRSFLYAIHYIIKPSSSTIYNITRDELILCTLLFSLTDYLHRYNYYLCIILSSKHLLHSLRELSSHYLQKLMTS